MKFLLDTNLISESVKLHPHPGVVRWLSEVPEESACLSVVSLAEIRRGIERLASSEKKNRLEAWLTQDLPQRFFNRILPVDAAVADAWGVVVAHRDAIGRPIAAMDALLAATALVHGLALVTRNVADFSLSLPTIVNPWQ